MLNSEAVGIAIKTSPCEQRGSLVGYSVLIPTQVIEQRPEQRMFPNRQYTAIKVHLGVANIRSSLSSLESPVSRQLSESEMFQEVINRWHALVCPHVREQLKPLGSLAVNWIH